MELFTHIGFTGTQEGLTTRQLIKLKRTLSDLTLLGTVMVLHHGDCIGADAEAHKIAKRMQYKIALHPPIEKRKRAFCFADIKYAERPYLERNREIVDMCSLLIVCPKEKIEVLRSGTWSAYRYAKKQKKNFIIIEP
jgi:hypothetical protein